MNITGEYFHAPRQYFTPTLTSILIPAGTVIVNDEVLTDLSIAGI